MSTTPKTRIMSDLEANAYQRGLERGLHSIAKVTRFEVIEVGEGARAYVRYGVKVEMSLQDEGRTLKAFVTPRRSRAHSQIKNPITGTWTKRDDKSGKFMDVKADAKPFKGVRKEKKKGAK